MASEVNNYDVQNNYNQHGDLYDEHHYHEQHDHTNLSASGGHAEARGGRSSANGNYIGPINISQHQDATNWAVLAFSGVMFMAGVAVLSLALIAAAMILAVVGGGLMLAGGLLYYGIQTAPYRYQVQLERQRQEHEITLLEMRQQHESEAHLIPVLAAAIEAKQVKQLAAPKEQAEVVDGIIWEQGQEEVQEARYERVGASHRSTRTAGRAASHYG
jgi:hypothetical protein